MGNRLKDRVAVVTGSGQGIGKAVAIALAREGARIVTNNRRPGTPGGDAETAANEILQLGGKAVPFFGDISSFQVAGKLVQKAVNEFGRLDILVNNAGIANMSARTWNITEKDWDECLDSHLKGSFNCIRHASVMMKNQRWGRIINTSSMAWLGNPPHCNYGAAKAGIIGLTRAVAREIGGYGVTCNAYCPNAGTRGLMTDEIQAALRRTYEAGLVTKEQYEELLHPPSLDTIGPLIVYLCTDEAADINGQVFDVKGGEIAIYSEPIKEKIIFRPEGLWTIDELIEIVPKVLLEGHENPAPFHQDSEAPGQP